MLTDRTGSTELDQRLNWVGWLGHINYSAAVQGNIKSQNRTTFKLTGPSSISACEDAGQKVRESLYFT